MRALRLRAREVETAQRKRMTIMANRTNTTNTTDKTDTTSKPNNTAPSTAKAADIKANTKEERAPLPKVRITYVKSVIGYNHKQRDTIKSLGLRRLHQSVEHFAT